MTFFSCIANVLKRVCNYINNYYPIIAGIIFVLPTVYLEGLFFHNSVHYMVFLSITIVAFLWFIGVTWRGISKDNRAIANTIYTLTQVFFIVILKAITKPNNESYLFNGELYGVNFNLLIFPLIIIWFLITIYFDCHLKNDKLVMTSKGIVKQPNFAINNLINDEDRKVATIHEIGHLFGYLAVGLKNLPSHFHARIYKEQTEGSLGYVTNIDLSRINPLDFNYAKMLVLIASSVAEEYYFGKCFSGSEQDLERWEELARNYLITVGDGYFVKANNYYEAEYNVIKLHDLRQKQKKQIQELIEANDSILYKLKNALLEKETLNLDEIKEFFKEVVLPDDFPVYRKSEKLLN